MRLLAILPIATGPALADPLDIFVGPVLERQADDLVTNGLGIAGLAADADLDPTDPEDLQTMLLKSSGRAEVGYGRTYGPNIDPATEAERDAVLPAGREFRALVRTGPGVSVALLQVPDSFDPAAPCMVGISTAGTSDPLVEMNGHGFWGFMHGCAVVWSDKGAGSGAFDLASGRAVALDGTSVDAAGNAPVKFTLAADEIAAAREAGLGDRVAYKWANAGWSNEEYAGDALLNALHFGFETLDRLYDAPINPGNTVVIATGHSGGGGGAIQAAERDIDGLIDGVVARAPQTQTFPSERIAITAGGETKRATARNLADYFAVADLYRICALGALPDDPAHGWIANVADRCTGLAEKGLVSGETTEAQAADALAKLTEYGFSDAIEPFLGATALFELYTYGLVSQYGGFTLAEHLCNYSIGAVSEGKSVATPPETAAQLGFIARSGKPDRKAVDLLNDADPSGPHSSRGSTSASTGRADYNLDGALCLLDAARSPRVVNTVARLLMDGDLHGKPTIIVQGAGDEVLPADMVARPYVGLNSIVEGEASRLRYIDLPNAMHGDPYLKFGETMVPWGLYHIRALELMWNTLTEDAPLPPHQVVRARVENGEAVLPPIAMDPAPADRIIVENGHLTIPQ
ncbi:3-hydroxybutyrate oligomer hydrolase family protein [Acuticoccus kandeliae]|uniref:3-hydroxybutyrate oligomer hydrolase family protein n=1 Tax=Acuticoccus kandeliae TaxID=2073160 RepID=UPI001300624F|nr:3-hydroxybutyrate oligomer hydrolase family protein [Acuticoccus kandeliae]